MARQDVCYRVWLSKDDDQGNITVVVDAVENNGQTRMVGDRNFGPWDDWEAICAWVWRRVSLALETQAR